MKYGIVGRQRAGAIESPPSRGAWIEINRILRPCARKSCRPPRGGRGLKCICITSSQKITQSPPSRGAWIEIFPAVRSAHQLHVAPLVGGVD